MIDLRLVGSSVSPYTRKLRALLRYRRIPYQFVRAGGQESEALPPAPLPLIPYVVLPDQNGELTEAMADTTPIINRLEDDYPERAVRPMDPALAVIDALLEEFGDEWLAKCMFHFRWSKPADTQTSSSYLAYAMNMTAAPEQGEAFASMFAERQISRIGVVGSNDTTGPLIEESWERYLDVFDRHLQNQPFLLGNRPGAGDYGCFGQMTMLVLTDPTPQAVSRRISPRAFAWTEAMEDHSGLEVDEADWINLDSPPETLNELLCEVGRLFAPFMVENGKAVASGEEMLECELDGRPWVQEAFVYQAKCLTWLKQRYDHLGEMDKARLDNVLSGTGCDALFANKEDKDEKRHSQ